MRAYHRDGWNATIEPKYDYFILFCLPAGQKSRRFRRKGRAKGGFRHPRTSFLVENRKSPIKHPQAGFPMEQWGTRAFKQTVAWNRAGRPLRAAGTIQTQKTGLVS